MGTFLPVLSKHVEVPARVRFLFFFSSHVRVVVEHIGVVETQ